MDGYVALKRLRWGDGWIEPGEPVPADDPGRSYQSMTYHGLVAPLKEAEQMSDEELSTAYDKALTDRDAALQRVADLESAAPVEIPDDVTVGETPGWPVDAVTGGALALTDEQRDGLAAEGISGEAIVTHQGDIVQIEADEEEGHDPEGDDAAKTTEEADVSDDKRVEVKKPEDPASVKKPPAKRKEPKKPAGK